MRILPPNTAFGCPLIAFKDDSHHIAGWAACCCRYPGRLKHPIDDHFIILHKTSNGRRRLGAMARPRDRPEFWWNSADDAPGRYRGAAAHLAAERTAREQSNRHADGVRVLSGHRNRR